MLHVKTQIGHFDREVIFLEKTITDGDSNEDKITGWAEIATDATVPASKQESRGNELALADRVTYAQPTHFIIRYRDDITVEMRLVCEQKVYEITSTVEEGRRRFLTIVTNLIDNEVWT